MCKFSRQKERGKGKGKRDTSEALPFHLESCGLPMTSTCTSLAKLRLHSHSFHTAVQSRLGIQGFHFFFFFLSRRRQRRRRWEEGTRSVYVPSPYLGIESPPGSLLQAFKHFSHNLYSLCHFAYLHSFYSFPSWVSNISILLTLLVQPPSLLRLLLFLQLLLFFKLILAESSFCKSSEEKVSFFIIWCGSHFMWRFCEAGWVVTHDGIEIRGGGCESGRKGLPPWGRDWSIYCFLKLYQTACHASDLLYSFKCLYVLLQCSAASPLTNPT